LVARQFRFGVLFAGIGSSRVSSVTSRRELQQKARRLEGLGFDVLSMPDHIGSVAPFPALAAAAQFTSAIRLGTCVLNACFYVPALLARDAAEVNLLSDGRLELGLGAGYVKEEFDAAELSFPVGSARIKHLEQVTTYLKERLPEVPVMVAGNGNRLLNVAARTADIVGLTGEPANAGIGDPLAERAAFISDAAGARFTDIELNLLVAAIPTDGSGRPDLALPRRHLPDLSDSELLALPGVLQGSPGDIANTLCDYRDRYGVTYITVMEFHAEHFAKVMAELQ
jgi:probable F420-dependent oxidoreductase